MISLIKSYVSYLNKHKSELMIFYISMMILIIVSGITAKLTEALILTSGLTVIIHLNTDKIRKILFFSTMNCISSASLCILTAYLLNFNMSINILCVLTKLLLLILMLYYGLQKCTVKAKNAAAVICIIIVCLSAVHSANI